MRQKEKKMSIICFKELDNKIQVAADGRCISDGGGGLINDENLIKIHKISDKLIIGVTGIVDIIGVFKKFVIANKYVFETLDNVTDALPLFKRFNDYTSEYFGYDGDAINEFGGFLVANNVFHGVFYYGDYGQPYCVNDSFKTFERSYMEWKFHRY